MFDIDETAKISSLADIEDSILGTRIEVGARTQIDSFVKIKPAGGIGDCIIGKDCYINSGVVIYTGNGIRIGDKVLIAANCTLAPTNHGFHLNYVPILEQPFMESKGGIIIEDDVWIGANSVLLDGSRVGTGAIIAAGSVIRGHVESFSIYAGNPAKRIRMR